MSERKFAVNLQHLVDRDEALLESPEDFGDERPLIAVVGFDGFMDCCHVYLRLIDYKENVAKESEMKGTGLCVASGDDHNLNLSRIFQNLGPEINKYIKLAFYVKVGGRYVRVEVVVCLDYSAARSVLGLRSNASPHSRMLSISLVIEAPKGSSWAKIKALILKKLPWRIFDDAKPLNHLATSFP